MSRLLLIPLLLLVACEQGPPAPTAAENRQLDEMENALDAEANRSGNAD